eukprot:scaffold2193_cov171-Amphora_coffeaeformis.AAC.24
MFNIDRTTKYYMVVNGNSSLQIIKREIDDGYRNRGMVAKKWCAFSRGLGLSPSACDSEYS